MQKKPPCPNAENGKHSWTFVKNTKKGSVTFGSSGTRAAFSVVGVYSCACGARRTGRVNFNAPGASL